MIMRILFFLLIVLNASLLIAQCKESDLKNLENLCASKLKTFEYSNTYLLPKKMFTYGGETIEFKKTFFKGTTYLITLPNSSEVSNKMVVDIFDDHHRKVASNHIKGHERYYSKIFFPCKATSNYFIKYSFSENKPSCGASVIGFSSDFLKQKQKK